MTDYTELKRLAEAATQGEWQVIETELPCRIVRPHVERRIFTAKDHPQLKAPYPVVNGSVALGTDETPVHHMVSMIAEDAAFIAAANPTAVMALIAENERNQRMVLSACMSMGAICESLGLDMDSDGDEMLGMVAELKAERDQLRAEVAGLRTGYEAYERVNAELKQKVANLEVCQTVSLGMSGIIKCVAGELGFDGARPGVFSLSDYVAVGVLRRLADGRRPAR